MFRAMRMHRVAGMISALYGLSHKRAFHLVADAVAARCLRSVDHELRRRMTERFGKKTTDNWGTTGEDIPEKEEVLRSLGRLDARIYRAIHGIQ
jgi:hypothetical protein